MEKFDTFPDQKTLLDRLGKRDLVACMQPMSRVDPNPPGWLPVKPEQWKSFAGQFRKKEKPVATHHALTGKIDSFSLVSALKERNALPAAFKMDDLVDGWYQILAIDQLALSEQPQRVVLELAKKGYGVWPIPKGISFKDIDLDKLKIQLDREQRGLLRLRESPTDEESAYWFKIDGLSSPVREMPQPYYPNLTQTLWLFQQYLDQEETLPNTHGNWLNTSSGIQVSLEDNYSQTVGQFGTKQVFIDACINKADVGDIVRKFKAVPGDMYTKIDDKSVTKKGQEFWISNYANLFLYHQIGDSYLGAKTGDETIFFGENKSELLVKRDYANRTLLTYPFSTISREIAIQQEAAGRFFSKPLDIPFVVSSNPREGVQIGMGVQEPKNVLHWTMANGFLDVDYWDVLKTELGSKFAYLPIVDQSSWPRIVSDHYAHNLFA